MNHLLISTSRILHRGSYHWHKSETVEELKLHLAEHHMRHLQILKPHLHLLLWSEALLNGIHTNWSYSLKSLLEEVYQAEFCCLLYQMLFAGQSESWQYTLWYQNFLRFCNWKMIEIEIRWMVISEARLIFTENVI